MCCCATWRLQCVLLCHICWSSHSLCCCVVNPGSVLSDDVAFVSMCAFVHCIWECQGACVSVRTTLGISPLGCLACEFLGTLPSLPHSSPWDSWDYRCSHYASSSHVSSGLDAYMAVFSWPCLSTLSLPCCLIRHLNERLTFLSEVMEQSRK